MLHNASRSIKLLRIGASLLILALASIGLTLWLAVPTLPMEISLQSAAGFNRMAGTLESLRAAASARESAVAGRARCWRVNCTTRWPSRWCC